MVLRICEMIAQDCAKFASDSRVKIIPYAQPRANARTLRSKHRDNCTVLWELFYSYLQCFLELTLSHMLHLWHITYSCSHTGQKRMAGLHLHQISWKKESKKVQVGKDQEKVQSEKSIKVYFFPLPIILTYNK